MGEQVNIYALAERMIRLCGLRPHDDIEIKVTGLRPGEKLAESLIGPAETSAADLGALLHSIEPAALGPTRLAQGLELLERLTIDDDHVAAREVLLDLARAGRAPLRIGPRHPAPRAS